MANTDLSEPPVTASGPADEGGPEASRIPPWTVKGMPLERRGAINRAAKANSETVAEYLWRAHQARQRADRWPPSKPIKVEGSIDGRDDQRDDRPASALNFVELFEVICKLASTEPAAGNKTLLSEARSVLYDRLRSIRGVPTRQPQALPGKE